MSIESRRCLACFDRMQNVKCMGYFNAGTNFGSSLGMQCSQAHNIFSLRAREYIERPVWNIFSRLGARIYCAPDALKYIVCRTHNIFVHPAREYFCTPGARIYFAPSICSRPRKNILIAQYIVAAARECGCRPAHNICSRRRPLVPTPLHPTPPHPPPHYLVS